MFCHIVEVDLHASAPLSGTALYLKYDFVAGHRLLKKLVAAVAKDGSTGAKFGGVVTDVQPDQQPLALIVHPNSENKKFAAVSVVIHGPVACYLPSATLPPELRRHAQLVQWFKPKTTPNAVDAYPFSVDVCPPPNATLFVVQAVG